MISTDGLTKRFGDNVAVNSLALDVPRGEFFSFLGPNGAGKTTTIKMLVGLLRPTGGRASIGGFDVTKNPVEAKRLIGYIPDHPFLYEKLTGREFLCFVAGLYNMDDREAGKKAGELMETFGIGQVGNELVEDYSHGMRQKLSFCAAFIHDPRIVIIDEPWVGLDPRSIRFVKDFLKQRTRDGLTVFMSTHTLAIAEEISDRIAIINGGKLITVDTVDAIKASRAAGSLEEVFLAITGEDGPA
jgi:ABC-2 type transport system ATP-binding protein